MCRRCAEGRPVRNRMGGKKAEIEPSDLNVSPSPGEEGKGWPVGSVSGCSCLKKGSPGPWEVLKPKSVAGGLSHFAGPPSAQSLAGSSPGKVWPRHKCSGRSQGLQLGQQAVYGPVAGAPRGTFSLGGG